MYVFRDGRRRVSGRELLHALMVELRQLTAQATGDHLISALIRAAELESAIADSPDFSAECLAATASATDAIARAFLLRQRLAQPEQLIATLAALAVPGALWSSPLEGFAYYGLHPRSYADLAAALPTPGQVAVIGIRSIGCALSAVVLAALRARGVFAERTSVRPAGHPFNRKTQLSPAQRQWLAKFQSSSEYLICDEGPGLSGSSFLSTADAVIEAGAEAASIHFLCSRFVQPELLRARDGARRWGRFRSHVISFLHHLEEPGHWIGSGDWRSHPLVVNGNGRGEGAEPLPAVWTHMERAKFISRDGQRLYKFEGFGHYGDRAQRIAQFLAEHKFAPRLLKHSPNGFACYEFVNARHATAVQLSESSLRRFAAYCDLRQRSCSAPPAANVDPEMTVAGMCAANLREAFGREADFCSLLPLERPVLSDSRMMPHEWLITDSGSLLKVDGASHGDDHFFPGPCDIAWDLAGLIVEWGLSSQAADFMCNEYRRLSGDSPAARLPGYILAYSLFRMGYCQMAAEALAGTAEAPGLEAASASYREIAASQIDGLTRRCACIQTGVSSVLRHGETAGGSPLL